MAERESVLPDHSANGCLRSQEINNWSSELRIRLADSLFMNSGEGICIADADERIIEVNPTLCQLTGFAREELIGKTPRVFHSGLQDVVYYQIMWKALLEQGQWRSELWNRRPDGSLYAVRLNISAVCNAENRLVNYVALMADITDSKLREIELVKDASHDALTGLPNRGLLADRLQQALAQAQRSKVLLAVCYLDLDGFKAINDQYGHATGDQVLVEVARRLSTAVRVGDTVARVGGDEFILLLWGLDQVEACDLTINRILTEVARPVLPAHMGTDLSASVGISLSPLDGTTPAELLARADSAMYRAKLEGGNRFRFFSGYKT